MAEHVQWDTIRNFIRTFFNLFERKCCSGKNITTKLRTWKEKYESTVDQDLFLKLKLDEVTSQLLNHQDRVISSVICSTLSVENSDKTDRLFGGSKGHKRKFVASFIGFYLNFEWSRFYKWSRFLKGSVWNISKTLTDNSDDLVEYLFCYAWTVW